MNTLKCRWILALVLLVCGVQLTLFALPSSYVDGHDPDASLDPRGWMELGFTLKLIPETGQRSWMLRWLFFGEDLTWIRNDHLGFGMSIGAGKDFFLFTIDGAYFLDPLSSKYLAFPLHGRVGINFRSDELLYASLSGGAELFLGHWRNLYRHDPGEEVCLNLIAAGGLYYYDKVLHWGTEFGTGFSSAHAYSPGQIVYY
jgi:hypothetical protein